MSDPLNSCCENHEGRQLVGMRTMERNRIQQVIERFSKKQITQHIKFLSAQITAIEGQVDDEFAQRCNPIIKAFAARLKADGQTLQSHLRVACIRKLFALLNALLKTGQPENRPNHLLRTWL